MEKTRLTGMVVCALVLWLGVCPAAMAGDYINPGIDHWVCPEAMLHFGGDSALPPIPADFFEPGSDPFDGVIAFVGSPGELGADVELARLTQGDVVGIPPQVANIDTEIVALSLVSAEPIMVMVGGNPQMWDVELTLSATTPPPGTLTATKTHTHGGFFEILPLGLQSHFVFTRVSDSAERVLDTGAEPIGPLVFGTAYPCVWDESPIGNDFNARELVVLVTGGSEVSVIVLDPYQVRYDEFWVNLDYAGVPIAGGGTGFNDGAWYNYPNFDWRNQWFYDHPYSPFRKKLIAAGFAIQPSGPNPYATVAYNWTTPLWSSLELRRPPLPGDVAGDPNLENAFIERSVVFDDVITDPIIVLDCCFEIMDYNPEWISIDIRGQDIEVVDGWIKHVCLPKDEIPVIEACCYPDGSCADVPVLECLAQGGRPQGPESTCAEAECPVVDDCQWLIEDTKFLQVPDVTPEGIDVSVMTPRIVADGFLCNRTGYITDVHLWGSWFGDRRGQINNIQLGIFADIPAEDPCGPGYSTPGEMLWTRSFGGDEFYEFLFDTVADEVGEYWWDPFENGWADDADRQIWQINICIDPNDAFRQLGSENFPVVYWLGLQVEVDPNYPDPNHPARFGWKTSVDHWNDSAVWSADIVGPAPLPWAQLLYQQWHPAEGNVDMAFAITGEPCYTVGGPRGVCGDIVTQTQYDNWEAAGRPELWCCPYQPCGDANGDGFVNPEDYLAIYEFIGIAQHTHPMQDVNHDGFVNPEDYLTVFANIGEGFGVPCPPLP